MLDSYKFFRKETSEWEKVLPEKWRWEVEYEDGTTLKQFDDKSGEFHQFAEIDQSKLHLFKMVSDENPTGYHLLFNPAEMKLIHFYRHAIFNMLQGKDEVRLKLYIFGYEKNINGRTYKNLTFIMPDGGTIITDDPTKIQLAPLVN